MAGLACGTRRRPLRLVPRDVFCAASGAAFRPGKGAYTLGDAVASAAGFIADARLAFGLVAFGLSRDLGVRGVGFLLRVDFFAGFAGGFRVAFRRGFIAPFFFFAMTICRELAERGSRGAKANETFARGQALAMLLPSKPSSSCMSAP